MTVDYFVLEVNVNLDMYDNNELFDVFDTGTKTYIYIVWIMVNWIDNILQ